jgi:formylglycine-generating enzyme required for sulfatase activity
MLGMAAASGAGCGDSEPEAASDDDDSEKKKKKKKKKDDDAEADASAATSASAAPNTPAKMGDGGPMVTIAAGSLTAGSRCYDIPRVRPNEFEAKDVSLGEFQMDQYPYPNEPGKPAKVGVTWQEAKELCEQRGKRLCSELEWERACKGTKNHTYMWGEGFKKGQCDGRTDHLTDQRATCKTDFEVMDMMGLALEWTASDWERGPATGQKVVRGARAEKVSWLSARCAHSRKRDPNKGYDNLGFRCCKGPDNNAVVQLRQRLRSTIEEESDIDTEFEMTLMRAMRRDHRGIVGVELDFDEVWRWHPVPNEEMIVARWRGKPSRTGPFYEIAVFKLCGNRAYRAATMRGPVERIGKPKVGVNSRKLSFDVRTGKNSGEVEISFWHGYVKLTEPAFVKKGNQLRVSSGRKATKTKRRRILKARPR